MVDFIILDIFAFLVVVFAAAYLIVWLTEKFSKKRGGEK
jgi:preprotein translocase subunit SecY